MLAVAVLMRVLPATLKTREEGEVGTVGPAAPEGIHGIAI